MIEEALKRIETTKLENLHYLDLRGLNLNEIPKEILQLPWIQALSLSDNNLSDITLLSQLPNIHKLALTKNNISDIAVLEKLPKLRFIFLGDNQVSDITPVIKHARLKKLVLNNNQVMKIPQLNALPLLAYLDISQNPCSKPSNEEMLTMCPVLRIYKT